MISVVASSCGGYLAMLYALEKPDKINKLVLEGSPAMVESSRIPFFMKMMLTPGIKWMAPKLPITKFIFRKIMKEMGHGYSLDLQIIPGAFIDWYVSLFNHTATQKNDIALISNAVPGGKLNTEFVLYDHEIERVCLPVLWLWGNDDAFAGPGVGQRIHSKMKNSSILFFENSGHLPWLDQPERHAAVIKSFFQTLLRRV